MTGEKERKDPEDIGPAQKSAIEPILTPPHPGSGLLGSLVLILIGVSIGVFWREVFELALRAIRSVS